jgi:predicted  nucleic acid-binding Zn-ribbon protein
MCAMRTLLYSHPNPYNLTMSRASSLYRLQELDLDLDRARARIGEIEVELADDEELRSASARAQVLEEKLSEARTANLGAEHAVASQQAKIRSSEQALYGGSVTNPKELQDLQMEVESLKRVLETLEDRLLEAMLELEEAQAHFDKAHQAVDDLQAARIQETAQLRGELSSLKDDLERLSVERQAAIGDVDPADLKRYEDLRDRLGGHAVVLMRGGSCSACGVDLAHSQVQEVRSSEEPFRCPQCSRFLYAG